MFKRKHNPWLKYQPLQLKNYRRKNKSAPYNQHKLRFQAGFLFTYNQNHPASAPHFFFTLFGTSPLSGTVYSRRLRGPSPRARLLGLIERPSEGRGQLRQAIALRSSSARTTRRQGAQREASGAKQVDKRIGRRLPTSKRCRNC